MALIGTELPADGVSADGVRDAVNLCWAASPLSEFQI